MADPASLPFEKALQLANSISQNRSRNRTQTELARKLYKQCQTQKPERFDLVANSALLEMETYEQSESSTDLESRKIQCMLAIDQFEQALALNKSWWEGHYNVANLYADLGPEGETKAIEHYKDAVKLNDTDADLYNNLSIALMKAGQLQDSLFYAKIAVRLDSNNPRFLLNIAELYNQTGDDKRAIYFAKKSETKSSLPEFSFVEIQSCILLSSLFEKIGDLDQSIGKLFLAIQKGKDMQMLCLAERIRCYSLLAARTNSAGEDFNIARQLMSEAAQLYIQKFPADLIGIHLLQFFTNIGTSTDESAVLANRFGDWQKQAELSTVAEKFLLNLRLTGSSELAHKCKIADNLRENGFEAVAPPTYVVSKPDDVCSILQKKENTGKLWFLKDPALQRGQGISILKAPFSDDTISRKMKKGRRYCLQECVTPKLLNGRKFGVRIHVFVMLHLRAKNTVSVYMLPDGILTMCGKHYEISDTSALNQITCTSIQRGLEGFDRAKVKSNAYSWSEYQNSIPKIEEIVMKTVSSVKSKLLCSNHSYACQPCGQLFGYDFLFKKDGDPVFIEANTAPQFQDSKVLPALIDTIAFPLINGFLDIIRPKESQTEAKQCATSWKHIGDLGNDN